MLVFALNNWNTKLVSSNRGENDSVLLIVNSVNDAQSF